MEQKTAKAILIDDDMEFHEIFRKALEAAAAQEDFPVELTCRSGIEGDGREADGFDIYFVDVELGQDSGIELVSGLQRRNFGKEFIFVSAHEEHMQDSMLAKPRYFVCKRRLETDLLKVTAFLRKLWGARHERVKVGQEEVCPRLITWCESDGHYVDVHSEDGERFLLRASLGQLEDLFGGFHYIRIHNRRMVNLEYVDRFQGGNQVILKDGTVLQASRAYQKTAQEGLREWFESRWRQ